MKVRVRARGTRKRAEKSSRPLCYTTQLWIAKDDKCEHDVNHAQYGVAALTLTLTQHLPIFILLSHQKYVVGYARHT